MRFRWFGLVLIAGLAVLGSLGVRADDTVDPEQRALEETLYRYMSTKPDMFLSALRAAEDRVKAEMDARARTALDGRRNDLLDDPTSPVAGNPKGDVTIVEFFDYRCPYCKQVEPALEALLREDGNVRLVYKEFPILGKASVYASQMALAAQQQGKYEAFHTAMMAAKGKIDEQVVLNVAQSAGIDLDRAKKDMAGRDIDAVIKRNIDLAEAIEVRGTPAFIIGGELIPGAVDIATLKEKIALARKG